MFEIAEFTLTLPAGIAERVHAEDRFMFGLRATGCT